MSQHHNINNLYHKINIILNCAHTLTLLLHVNTHRYNTMAGHTLMSGCVGWGLLTAMCLALSFSAARALFLAISGCWDASSSRSWFIVNWNKGRNHLVTLICHYTLHNARLDTCYSVK